MTIKLQILLLLTNIYMAYKKDLLLYSRYLTGGDDAYANKVVNKMIREGELLEKNIVKEKRDTEGESYVALYISDKGKKYIKKKLGAEILNTFDEVQKNFRTIQTNILRKHLNDNRIKIMFEMCEVPTYQKPKLKDLYEIMKTNPTPEYQKLLDNGLYYTVKEIREFIDTAIGEGISDTTYSSRIKGLFLSTTNAMAVYITKRGDNKIQKTSDLREKRLLKRLEPLLSITKVNRPLPTLAKKKKSRMDNSLVIDKQAQNGVWGLMISDGDSLVYSMASGSANGIIRKPRKTDSNKETTRRYSWLTGENQIYSRMFVTPFTVAGVGSLNYLCHTSAEEWYKEAKEFMLDKEQFEENVYNPLYCADEIVRGRKQPAIYMPVFEVNELKNISDMDYDVTVVTYPDMINAISHATRKENRYYDADTMELVNREEIMIYGEKGYPKGQEIIQEELKRLHIKADKREITRLHKKYDMTRISFFNGIAEGEIDLHDAINKLPLKVEKKEPRKYNKRKKVSVDMPSEIVTTIKKAAKYKDLSMNRYLINLIMSHIEEIREDARKYKEG